MQIAIIGANGQLGTDLCQQLSGFALVPLMHKDIEIADVESVKRSLSMHKPDVIINTAAFVAVDDCESQPDKAYIVNALGAGNVASVAYELGAKLIYISTECVFGGEGGQRSTPYTEFDVPVPVNVYGKSKLAGENLVQHLCPRHLIIRISTLFGVARCRGRSGNFVEIVLRLSQENDELRIVCDRVTTPTYSKDLARKIAQLLVIDCYGIIHVTNKGTCSFYEFAQEIIRLVGSGVRVVPITSEQYPLPAKRPSMSALDDYRLTLMGMNDMMPWQEAVRDYLREKGYLN